jgi:SAM-dependent methyltransferase
MLPFGMMFETSRSVEGFSLQQTFRQNPMAGTRDPRFPEPGGHTAYGEILPYRVGKLAQRGIVRGDWLDCGCAEGYYAKALAEHGASRVVGVDAIDDLVRRAQSEDHPTSVSFLCAKAESLPFPNDSFDGALLNEVLEHVSHERKTLAELTRVLRPGGHLALFSPNRWFPFEGHGLRINAKRSFGHPVPIMPWLPGRLTRRFASARNYWPSELRQLVEDAGFEIVEAGWALPQFELYKWMPAFAIKRFRRAIPRLERSPVARFAAVSTFILARVPPGP